MGFFGTYMDAVAQGLTMLLQPLPFALLILGVFIGMFAGLTPGFTGLVAMAIIVPMVWGMPPIYAVPLFIGLMAVTATSDTIAAVMVGTPSDARASATVMDGYPLAKQGQAARALGAAFSASALGGIFGAIVLALTIPVARLILKQFLSPEFFMLCLLGVVLVGGLTSKAPLKGLFAGGFGLLLSVIGSAPGVGHYRFTFDLPYLYAGLPLIAVALGLIALPEMADLFIKGTQIQNLEERQLGRKGILQGYKDTIKNWWLVIRSCTIGAWIGFAPGIGGTAASWMAYSHAVTSEKDGNFGKGDIRGVIAPESSNNAVMGGDLIPTLLFGIPGSGIMAVFLMGLIVVGISPGPNMIEKDLPLTFSIIWSLVLANIIATAACSLMARPISQLTKIDVHYIVPYVLMFILAGVYQATQSWGDLIVLAVFGGLGWTMKRLGWPRPPLLIGFILGSLADKYLWISVTIFGISWLWRPWVLGILAAGIASVWYMSRKGPNPKKEKKRSLREDRH